MPLNRLAREKSPYLQQHAANPVDWYPWGDEAFEKARREDKPIFLSIGYSTCHWCHVMERESFENEAIAALMNKWFVSVKVDREERPDIDHIYMNFVQATTGGGGWPMSVWLTPDLEPFTGGTYFPPENRYGRAGFPLVLERIAEAWRNDREKITQSGRELIAHMRVQAAAVETGADRIGEATLDTAYAMFRRIFDAKLGGFGGAPKFPRPSVHNFLLRYWKRTANDEALDMVVTTLIAMDRGGMHDQLGGGFHRYSVDEFWFVPHFEKMLYDQAQLAISFLEAFQIAREPALERAVRRTLDYVMRDMTAPGGAFYSAEDADSATDPAHPHDKTEGAFYVWGFDEVEHLLGPDVAAKAAAQFGMRRDGNVEHDPHGEFTGKNILFQAESRDELPAEARERLLAARSERPRPHLDDKILTAWNGLMISAFSKAGAALDEARYISAAEQAADFVLTALRDSEGGLLRRFRDGEAAIGAMLDDYAFFVQGLLDLYEATFDFQRLEQAISLTAQQIAALEDAAGGFFSAAQPDTARLVRSKDDYDGAEPAGNSVALMNLLRLARMTGDDSYEQRARRLLRVFEPKLRSTPWAMPQMLAACEFDLAPHSEAVVTGGGANAMTRLLRAHFDPNRILLHAGESMQAMQPRMKGMAAQDGDAVFLCADFVCNAPVHDAESLFRLLK